MSVFQADCPYCGTKSVAFTILHQQKWIESHYNWDTFAKCGHCGRGIVATFKTDHSEWSPNDYLESRRRGLSIPEIAPSLPDTGAPRYTPENVARFFKQAMDNLPNNWDAAGSMFRKALDTGLRSKFSEMEGTLYARIKEAAEKQQLTPDLAEWAHQIRLGGNEAAHEEEPFSKDDATELFNFTRLVFLYLFTLPGMLEESRREEKSSEKHA